MILQTVIFAISFVSLKPSPNTDQLIPLPQTAFFTSKREMFEAARAGFYNQVCYEISLRDGELHWARKISCKEE